MDEMTLKLNSPITDEQWDDIVDVDFDHTDRIWFSTKHGKKVEFIKPVFCKDCKYADKYNQCDRMYVWNSADDYCSRGERKDGN